MDFLNHAGKNFSCINKYASSLQLYSKSSWCWEVSLITCWKTETLVLSFKSKIVGVFRVRIGICSTTKTWTNGYQLSLVNEKFWLVNSVQKPFKLYWLSLKTVSCPKQVPLFTATCFPQVMWGIFWELAYSAELKHSLHRYCQPLKDYQMNFVIISTEARLLHLYVQPCSLDCQMLFYSILTTIYRLHWPVDKLNKYFKVSSCDRNKIKSYHQPVHL